MLILYRSGLMKVGSLGLFQGNNSLLDAMGILGPGGRGMSSSSMSAGFTPIHGQSANKYFH